MTYNGGTQTVGDFDYANLVLSGTSAKTISSGTTVSGNLSIAPTGTATASLATGLNLSVNTLTLGGIGQANGTWGSTSSSATYTNNTYFAASTGIVTVATNTSPTPTLTTPTATSITDTTATLGANITYIGSASITQYGTCWGTSAAPSGNCSTKGAGTAGVFTDARTGLTATTLTYYRGYATNSYGTSYSSDGSFYTEPATQASGVNFTAITSTGMTVNWTRGSGSGVIVLMRAGSPVSSDPVDGTYTTYTASTAFGSGTQIGSGNYVIYKGTGTSVAVTGLTPGSTYYVAAYEYAGAVNTSGAAQGTNYKLAPATGNQATPAIAPSLSAPTATSILDTTATLGATVTSNGGAALTDRGTCWGASAAPTTNCAAEGGTTVSSFTQNWTGLTAGTLTYYRGYATNSAGTGYSSDGSFYTEPATQASGVNFTAIISTGMTVNWTRGSGDGVIVLMKSGSPVSSDPSDGTYTTYTASTAFGSGTQIGSGNYVIYKGTGTSVAVTGLTPGSTYYVAAYEYAGAVNTSGAAQGTNYKLAPATGNQATPAIAPSLSTPTATSILDTTATLGATVTSNGGAALTDRGTCWGASAAPTTNCTAEGGTTVSAFTMGVTGLNAGSLTYYRGYATNSAGTGYSSDGSFYTEPATQASGVNFTTISGTGMIVNWTRGSGDGVIVLMRFGSAVSTGPSDGTYTGYTASTVFGNGTSIPSTGSSRGYVIYKGTSTSVAVTGLTSGTTYYVAVYEYAGAVDTSGAAQGTNYKLTPATGNQATATSPILSTPTATSILDTTATLGATVTSDGGAALTARGTCWGTSAAPTGNCVAEGGTTVAAFTQARTGLTADTLTYYRGYATNSVGTGYSSDGSFYTEPATQASGVNFTAMTSTGMTVHWTRGSGSGVIVLMSSVSPVSSDPVDGTYTTYTASTAFGSGTQIGSGNYVIYKGTGTSVAVTGLTQGSTYYVAAYEYRGTVNTSGAAQGTNYKLAPATGNQATPAIAPSLSTPTATSILDTTATLGATVTSDGGAALTARGTCWGTSAAPTTNCTAEGGTTVSAFTQGVSGLTAGSLTYYRGYATNSVGTGYSSDGSFYTEPDTQASAVNFTAMTSTGMTVNWTRGSGSGVIVLMKSGSAVNSDPVDGTYTTYTANAAFGSGTQIGTGNYVIYKGTGTSVAVTGLTPGSTYYVAAYEYRGTVNTSGAAQGTNYKTPPTTGNQAIIFVPSLSTPTATAITSTTATLGATVTSDGGAALTDRGTCWGASAAPTTNCTAEGGTTVSAFTMGVNGLTAGTLTYYRGYATNSVGTGYSSDGSFYTEPDTQASAVNFTAITSMGMTVNWTGGNGDGVIVLMKSGSAVNSDPVDGTYTTYTANAAFGSGTQIGSGNYVIYKGTGTSVAVTGLTPGSTYYVAAYEYAGAVNTSGAAQGTNYELTPAIGNQATSAALPSLSTPTATAITSTTATLGATVTSNGGAVLTDRGTCWGITPSPLAHCMSEGNTTVSSFTQNWTGLTAGTLTYYRGYATNSAGTGYSSDGSFYTETATQASAVNFTAVTGTGMTVNWTRGSGDGVIVLMKSGSPVSTDPLDGTYSYTANAEFGSGTQIGSGNYVIYMGTGTSVAVTGLTPGLTYYVTVYEYQGTANTSGYNQGTNYKTPPATGDQATVIQVPSLSLPTATAITSTTATLGATVTSNGGAVLLSSGICWGASAAPTTNCTVGGNISVSAFTQGVSGLTAGAHVYYRGFATNSQGTGYSPDGSFYTEPATQASGVNFTAVSSLGMTVNWTPGSGDGVIVLMKSGSAVSSDPSDGTYTGYIANPAFGSGTQVGSGNYFIYRGTGTSVAVTGLTVGTTYYVAVYEYAGAVDTSGDAQGTNYKLTPARGNQVDTLAMFTTALPVTATSTDPVTIHVTMPYGDDGNTNNTYTVDYKLSSDSTWINWVDGSQINNHTASPYITDITGLTPSTSYDVRATYQDHDGVTPTNLQTQTINGVLTKDWPAGTSTWTAPAHVTDVTVEAWGGGGKGADLSTTANGGGGGGGAYSRVDDIPVTPGETYTVVIGAGSTDDTLPGGDSYFIDPTTILAKGGSSVAADTSLGAAGGLASDGVGDVTYSGGAGAAGMDTYGGGGGSSAGTAMNGFGGTGSNGGTVAGGGSGGNGASGTQGNGTAGSVPGGGGGGAYRTSSGTRTGGNGAAGKVVITYALRIDTTLAVSCTPDSIEEGYWTTCTAAVTRSSGSANITGTVSWAITSGDDGRFSPSHCNLSGSNSTVACSVEYTANHVGSGAHIIQATYNGDEIYGRSTDSTTETVVPDAPPTIATNGIRFLTTGGYVHVDEGDSVSLAASPMAIQVFFDKDVFNVNNPSNPDYAESVTNPANYRVLFVQSNFVVRTTSCLDSVDPFDHVMPIHSITYSNGTDRRGPFVATINLDPYNGGSASLTMINTSGCSFAGRPPSSTWMVSPWPGMVPARAPTSSETLPCLDPTFLPTSLQQSRRPDLLPTG